MVSRRLVSLAVVLIWFYVFLAALLNPAYVPPNIPRNPVMPFLTADIVNQLWPLILVSVPLMLLVGQRIVRPSEGTRRQVSPQEFARIQARAHATKERAKREVGRQEPRLSWPTAVETPQSTTKEAISPAESLKREELAEELLRPVPKVGGPEFTPPPMTSRRNQASEASVATGGDQELASEPPSEQIEEQTAEQKEANVARRIEELEAERAAIASLLDRVEDMKGIGAIQPELYDKLKKKYISELEKINAKIEKLPLGSEQRK